EEYVWRRAFITGSRASAARLGSRASAMAAPSTSERKGLVRNSNAPAFMAWTVISTSPWPVRKMTGMSVRLATSFCRSRPLRPGSATSSTMQLGPGTRGWARNSFADENVFGCQPPRAISDSRDSRTATSVSTTNTIGLEAMAILLVLPPRAPSGTWERYGPRRRARITRSDRFLITRQEGPRVPRRGDPKTLPSRDAQESGGRLTCLFARRRDAAAEGGGDERHVQGRGGLGAGHAPRRGAPAPRPRGGPGADPRGGVRSLSLGCRHRHRHLSGADAPARSRPRGRRAHRRRGRPRVAMEGRPARRRRLLRRRGWHVRALPAQRYRQLPPPGDPRRHGGRRVRGDHDRGSARRRVHSRGARPGGSGATPVRGRDHVQRAAQRRP